MPRPLLPPDTRKWVERFPHITRLGPGRFAILLTQRDAVTLKIIPGPVAKRESKRKSITCTTCALRKCVGRCHFESVDTPRNKAA